MRGCGSAKRIAAFKAQQLREKDEQEKQVRLMRADR
jgi:hypothetical protein